MIKEIILCTAGSIAFAVTMKVPKRSIIFVSIGAFITACISIILSDKLGDFIPCIISMLLLSLYSEICAKALRQPSTIIRLPSTIPLLPGSYIYYCMLGAIRSDSDMFISNGKATILTALGISIGAVLSSILINIIRDLIKAVKVFAYRK